MFYKKKWYDDRAWLKMCFIDKGMTVSEIAVTAGISEQTVRSMLSKYNIKKGY